LIHGFSQAADPFPQRFDTGCGHSPGADEIPYPGCKTFPKEPVLP
jgi:hypothetical protein